ncbi:MAG TPA: VOC family protein [Acidimicrobiales bacterium]|nr:VOC family protein [Acidimicrobiales bacterium]
MPLRELFHFMQIVDDFDAAESFYDSLLDLETFGPKHYSDFDKRWASLSVVGPDFVLEIMEPSAAPEDQGAPLPKFRSRHGQHWHSLSWFVDADAMAGLIERLRGHGVRVISPYPTDEGVPNTIFTHPKDTFGQLEFQIRPEDAQHHRDPRFDEGFSAARWLEGPLHLERTSHLTTLVGDLDRAREFYEKCLEAATFHTASTKDRDSAFLLVGTNTVVELAKPTRPDSRIGRDFAEHGEIPHAATFKVRDLAGVISHVERLGVGFERDDDATITLDPAQAFGAVVSFTEAALPGDPRD